MAVKFDANLGWLFTELEFEERFAAAAAAGFGAVEYPNPYDYDASRLRALREDAGLDQILINTPQGAPGSTTSHGCACIPGFEDEHRRGVDRALEYATTLGARFIHVVAGRVPDGVEYAQARALLIENMAWAADQAAGTGVRLVLEAQNTTDAPGYVLTSQTNARDVITQVGRESVGLMFDFYHAEQLETDAVQTFGDVLPHVWHVQIADPPARHEPGTGVINWARVFTAISESDYDGWVGCEYKPSSATLETLDWMPA